MSTIYQDVTQTIGRTPLIQIRKVIRTQATVLAKLESHNPLASVKDRIGVAMIDAAELVLTPATDGMRGTINKANEITLAEKSAFVPERTNRHKAGKRQ